ncbi:Homocysteine S-methyltransferase 1 [Apophysomyces ossiformis]|uniref:Homocysteine S-methyltransferase 1 n=1 Tax=Apophysomyces ossiformis TaxID=679940 RepID=A0A8H7BJI5_9FUNG|nr:Homocysteine S-methyltransferase 1 [Apophysomyces ossiformis]
MDAQGLLGWLWFKTFEPIREYLSERTGVLVFSHLHRLSLDYHLGRKNGAVLQALERGSSGPVTRVITTLTHVLGNVLLSAAIGIGYFTYEFGPGVAGVVILAMALLISATYLFSRAQERQEKEKRHISQEGYSIACLAANEQSPYAAESLLNYEAAKYFTAEDYEISRYRSLISKREQAEGKVQSTDKLLSIVQHIIVSSSVLVGAYLAKLHYGTSNHRIGTASFLVFLRYMNQICYPIARLSSTYMYFMRELSKTEELVKILNEAPTVVDKVDATDLIVNSAGISFENVTFAYDAEKTVLHNVTFSVGRGQTLAIIGHTGAGKSTILRLLLRLFDTTSGQVRIDGQDISEVTQQSLRKHIAVVSQDIVLFNDTIRANVYYGNRNASEKEFKQAIEIAQLQHMNKLPEGYDTLVGNRGLKISGGEKQRVALARAIIKNAPILVLDEATSSIDNVTERAIQNALCNHTSGQTKIIIAHRLSTVVNADIILVMDEGKIVARGKHLDLIRDEQGIYYKMWQNQVANGHNDVVNNG